MLGLNLNTNEIKNESGTEQEFQHLDWGLNNRSREFALIAEPYNLQHRLLIGHAETGVGLKRRRRSRVGFRLDSISTVDSVTPITTNGYLVLDIPVGAMTSTTIAARVLANLGSFIFLDGSASTLLYAGTGTGGSCLLNGGL